jgi:hypothetical protein
VLPMAAINSAVRSVASLRRVLCSHLAARSPELSGRTYANHLRERDNLKSSVLTGNDIDHRGHAAAIGNVNEIGAASSQLCLCLP